MGKLGKEMKIDFSVIFNDKCRAPFDGPDGLVSVWFLDGNSQPM